VLARRAHDLSQRRRGPFVPINCAAIPEALFESELFGHERGAFTGANERVEGKVDAAAGGTLFLDEIGELPTLMQAKLLRFLENRRYMRVGGTKKLQANVRIIFATLRPLDDEVRAGRFRADLFYRIQGITVRVPPLAERRDDIGPLIDQFLSELSQRHGLRRPRLGRRARALLMRHDWPGNVRELRNVIETLCLLHEGKRITPRDLPASIFRAAEDAEADAARRASALTVDLDRGLDAIVRDVVEAVLAGENGSKGKAAQRLGISVRTVQRYVERGRVLGPVG
jgi:transcriptional regulator with PAS, ATPase and Fis domain